MNAENTNSLYKAFPKIFERKLTWGFEFNDGWYELTRKLCRELQEHIDTTNDAQVVCSQAKEKYGTLRFYIPKGSKSAFDIIDKYCKLSAITCEDTGGVGTGYKKGCWVKTLCQESAILLGYESVLKKGS